MHLQFFFLFSAGWPLFLLSLVAPPVWFLDPSPCCWLDGLERPCFLGLGEGVPRGLGVCCVERGGEDGGGRRVPGRELSGGGRGGAFLGFPLTAQRTGWVGSFRKNSGVFDSAGSLLLDVLTVGNNSLFIGVNCPPSEACWFEEKELLGASGMLSTVPMTRPNRLSEACLNTLLLLIRRPYSSISSCLTGGLVNCFCFTFSITFL